MSSLAIETNHILCRISSGCRKRLAEEQFGRHTGKISRHPSSSITIKARASGRRRGGWFRWRAHRPTTSFVSSGLWRRLLCAVWWAKDWRTQPPNDWAVKNLDSLSLLLSLFPDAILDNQTLNGSTGRLVMDYRLNGSCTLGHGFGKLERRPLKFMSLTLVGDWSQHSFSQFWAASSACSARSVVCVSVCWTHGWAVQKTGEPKEMPFGTLTHPGPRNHIIDGGQDRTNPFASTRGNKSAMRPFTKLRWTPGFLEPMTLPPRMHEPILSIG